MAKFNSDKLRSVCALPLQYQGFKVPGYMTSNCLNLRLLQPNWEVKLLGLSLTRILS